MISSKHSPEEQIVHRLKEIIAAIPYGHVATIEELTESLGLTADHEAKVIWALREINDNTVPTWRVVHDDGTLPTTSAAGDWSDQQKLLQSEGVMFVADDKVEVESHFWSACEYVKASE